MLSEKQQEKKSNTQLEINLERLPKDFSMKVKSLIAKKSNGKNNIEDISREVGALLLSHFQMKENKSDKVEQPVRKPVPENIPQIIVELLDERDNIVGKQIITSSSKVSFKYLSPKKYKLKATLDNDANGRWSPGNYAKKRLPEAVYYHKDVFDVKANWDIDLEETWKF